VSGPVRVLLVDDEAGFTSVLKKRLERRGYAVSVALSGAEALRALRGQDFDVAVVDLKMHDMDGLEILDVFRKMIPEMPVIMLTGHGSETAAHEELARGVFDFLLKSCELEDLMEKLNAAVGAGGEGA
jgi:Response regulator containing CheY-like receiver, AAA-type ATPase, and DNA-binding domains